MRVFKSSGMLLFLMILALILLAAISSYFLFAHVKIRVDGFLDGGGFQINKSLDAFINGGFFGKGFLNGTQSQLEFLPERGTDFIFAVFSEEFGFLGVIILFIFYLFIIMRFVSITNKAKTYYSKLLSGSITCIFIMLIITNVSMAVGVLPVVGVTLPLISLGGSSLLSIFIAFGIMFAISKRN